jgi:hypothetical protein
MPFGVITDTVSVYRLARTGDNEDYGATPVLTGLDCGIFPAGTEILAVYPGQSSYALHDIYVYEVCDLKNGDKLKSGSKEYIIRGVPQVVNNRHMYYQRLVGELLV